MIEFDSSGMRQFQDPSTTKEMMDRAVNQLSSEMADLLRKYSMRPLSDLETVEIDLDKSDHVSEVSAVICYDKNADKMFLGDLKMNPEPAGVEYDRHQCNKPEEGVFVAGTFHTHPFPYYIAPSPMDVQEALKYRDSVSCTGAYDKERGKCNVICFALDIDKINGIILDMCGDEFAGEEDRVEKCRDAFEEDMREKIVEELWGMRWALDEDGYRDPCIPQGQYVYKSGRKIVGHIPYFGKTPRSEEWDRRTLNILEKFAAVVVKDIPCD